jgi:primosomal protein N'
MKIYKLNAKFTCTYCGFVKNHTGRCPNCGNPPKRGRPHAVYEKLPTKR